ncbi:hypothetical protein VTO73DRAFT_5509 [Trametes versicolor]
MTVPYESTVRRRRPVRGGIFSKPEHRAPSTKHQASNNQQRRDTPSPHAPHRIVHALKFAAPPRTPH